jgi:hypothetical protein
MGRNLTAAAGKVKPIYAPGRERIVKGGNLALPSVAQAQYSEASGIGK